MDVPAVYPWTLEGEGLCRAMNDCAIWQRDLPPILARAFKKVAKKYQKQIGVSPYNPEFDRARFAGECVAILSMPDFRAQVLDRLRAANPRDAYPLRPLARAIWESVTRDDTVDVDTFCNKHKDGRHYLVPEKFGSWVAARPVSERNARTTALVGCTYAVLQPADATSIASALLQGGAELVALMESAG
jgi:hypothetical protein